MGKGGGKQIRHNVASSPDPTLALGSLVAERPRKHARNVTRSVMRKTALTFFMLAATFTVALAAERPMRFWNLTRHTISEFYLAPAGTTNWGANQCKNDRDGTVDSDERLRITDTPPGRYDAKLVDVSKRTCIVRNLELKAGEIFSIEEKELTSCTQ
jgi:hypothetical protein